MFSNSPGEIINHATKRYHVVQDNATTLAFGTYWLSRYLRRLPNRTKSKHVIDWRSKSPPPRQATTPLLPTQRNKTSQDLTNNTSQLYIIHTCGPMSLPPSPPHPTHTVSEIPLYSQNIWLGQVSARRTLDRGRFPVTIGITVVHQACQSALVG